MTGMVFETRNELFGQQVLLLSILVLYVIATMIYKLMLY
jgi:hypothetical protein